MTPADLAARLLGRAAHTWWRLRRPTTVGVRGLLIDGESVLLVRHRGDGGWYLPGGGVKRGESPEQALRREADEEAGAVVGSLALFGVYFSIQEGKSDHVIAFVSHSVTSAHRSNAETAGAALFPLTRLPDHSSPGTRRRVAQYLAGEWPCHGPW